MNKNSDLLYYLIMIVFFVILKFAYTLAETNHLTFLLTPTTKIIELVSGFQSVYIDNKGYYFQQLNIVIDKSCSGFNFLILNFLMLTFLFLNYFKKGKDKITAVFTALIIAYVFTIIINSFRINTAIIFEDKIALFVNLNRDIIHQAIGIIINLTFLILIYLITEKILNHKKNK